MRAPAWCCCRRRGGRPRGPDTSRYVALAQRLPNPSYPRAVGWSSVGETNSARRRPVLPVGSVNEGRLMDRKAAVALTVALAVPLGAQGVRESGPPSAVGGTSPIVGRIVDPITRTPVRAARVLAVHEAGQGRAGAADA